MSDSDSDLLSNNNFTLQNESTMVSAKGPNTVLNNITGISFQNNVLSSRMWMNRTFEKQRYAESNYSHQSMYHRRETSPMSVMSACGIRQRNLNNSFYPQRMSSQRSAFNGRSGSPMSQRSIDSSASVSAADIAMAFKTVNFNKFDLRVIKDAYNKLIKHKVRRKIEKRRNLRLFLKGSRRKSGGDSGEQASDSSLSSDDRSTRTLNYKENMSSCRSINTDISDFKRTIKTSKVYKDCTDTFRQNFSQSVTGGPVYPNSAHTSSSSHKSLITGSNISFRSMPIPANCKNLKRNPIIPTLPQKDRFKGRFLLPSHRFNRSIASTTILENTANVYHSLRNNFENGMNTTKNSAKNIETDSDQDDIFSATTHKQKTINNVRRKRSTDSDDDFFLPNQKRTKIISPSKNSIEANIPMPKETNLSSNKDVANDFVFARPAFPVRKSVKEKQISKSAASISDTFVQASIIPPVNIEQSHPGKPVEQEKEDQDDEPSNATQNTTDLSMRPSFIKRKLFTQKLDVSEKRNLSIDSFNSPQNSIYGAIQKEKHKARKLQQATTQSCLSRDMQQDESNLLDLIHKIVPIEQMNVTNQANKTDPKNNTNKTKENEDKWEVTSIISVQKNDEDGSDTYTDEEIFNATLRKLTKDVSKKPSPIKGKKVLAKENFSKKSSPMQENYCYIPVEKLPANYLQQSKKTNLYKDAVAHKSVQKCIKSFWDTDIDTDVECQPPPRIDNLILKENPEKETLYPKETTKFSSMFSSKKPATALFTDTSIYPNNTVDNVQKFNSTNLRIRSHRTPKRKKLHQTMDEDEKSAIFEPQIIKQKTFQASSCIELTKANIDSQNIKCKETVTKQLSKQNNKKSPRTKKQETKIKKCNETTESVEEIPSKNQINSTNKKQIKTIQTENKLANNQKEIMQSKQLTKKETANNKQKKITQKSNKKQDSSIILEQTKQVIDSQKSAPSKQKTNNKKQDLADKRLQIKKQLNSSNKNDKLVQDEMKSNKQTNTNNITAESKKQNKKTRNTKNTVQNNASVNDDTIIEENNNKSYRAIRSCRNNKQNEILDKSNLTLNGTIKYRSLRSRQIDLSTTTTLNGNIAEAKQKDNNSTKDAKSRLSDVSFSLASEKNAVAKRAVNSRRFKAKDVETSDVSFSLTMNESPKSQVNKKAVKKQNYLTKSTPEKKNTVQCRARKYLLPKNESRSCRNRTPNKRYLIC